MLIRDSREGYRNGVKSLTTLTIQDIRTAAENPGGFYRSIDLVIERTPENAEHIVESHNFSLEEIILLHRIISLYLSPTP